MVILCTAYVRMLECPLEVYNLIYRTDLSTLVLGKHDWFLDDETRKPGHM